IDIDGGRRIRVEHDGSYGLDWGFFQSNGPRSSYHVSLMRRGAIWVLTVLTVLNFFNYVDRYVLPAVLPQIKATAAFAGHSDAAFGFLQTAFLITYMIFSPIGGALGDRIKRKYIVAAGVGIWSLATLRSAL